MSKLHVGEDGRSLYDEEGRLVGSFSVVKGLIETKEQMQARRLSLAHQFAAAPELADVALRFLGQLEFDGAECTCDPGDVCPLCATKAALRKAGRI